MASGRGRKKASRGVQKYNKLYIHRNENIEEVDNIDGWMESHGWEKSDLMNHWTIDVADLLSVSTFCFSDSCRVES